MTAPQDALTDLQGARERPLSGKFGIVFAGLSIVIAVSHLYFNALSVLPDIWRSALHFGMFGLAAALLYPLARPQSPGLQRGLLFFDILLGVAAVGVAAYLISAETALYARNGAFVTSDWIAAAVAILVTLELARRCAGWFIPVLILIALSYVVLWGTWIDGVFAFPGLSWETLLRRSYFGEEGMFGPIARISWSFVFMFILFGAFLVQSGASNFIVRLARAAAGRLTGGPGLIAVLASGLMGSVTGSAVANTASTGSVTIPLMKRSGFSPRFAGGVEAAASTGGQLMPPVMGAGAFVMATFTQIPYLQIVAASIVPALLYFFTVGVFVRIEAQKQGLVPTHKETESLGDVLKEGWTFLLPLLVLIGMLVWGRTPTYAAGVATLSVIALSWISGTRLGGREILNATTSAVRTMTQTAILLIAIGLVVNVIGMTGVGNTFSLMITGWAGGSLLLTIVLVALASLVLGMGLPVTAAYIVLATLAAPALTALIQDAELIRALMAGVSAPEAQALIGLVAPSIDPALPMSAETARMILSDLPPEIRPMLTSGLIPAEAAVAALLSAHLIVFWLSQDSNVTPPVALAAFAAASIAESPPMRTGFMAWKLAKGLYLVPLLFAYTAIVSAGPLELAGIALSAAIAFLAIAGGLEGWMEGKLSMAFRLGLIGAGILCLPIWGLPWLSALGAALTLTLVFRGILRRLVSPRPS